jgi:predicted lipoprotein with Yx(FWY)xxD motif
MFRRSSLLLSFVSSVLVLAACGGSSGSNGGTAATPAPTPTPNPVVKTAMATVDGKSLTILVGENGMTLYYYTPDKGTGQATCTGQCLANWPPLLMPSGVTKPTGEKGVTGTLGTLTSPAGGMQVTYNSWPLYFWVKDKAPGDTTGQNVGGKWFVVPPDVAPGM